MLPPFASRVQTIQDIIVFLRNKTTEKSEDDEMEK